MIFPTIMFWVLACTCVVTDTLGNCFHREVVLNREIFTARNGDLIVAWFDDGGKFPLDGCNIQPSEMGVLVGPCLPIPKELR